MLLHTHPPSTSDNLLDENSPTSSAAQMKSIRTRKKLPSLVIFGYLQYNSVEDLRRKVNLKNEKGVERNIILSEEKREPTKSRLYEVNFS